MNEFYKKHRQVINIDYINKRQTMLLCFKTVFQIYIYVLNLLFIFNIYS